MLRILPIAFWIIGAANMLAQILHIELLNLITKPLLMVVLGAYYFLATKEHRTTAQLLILIGFVFSWSGDVNLMFVKNNENFFLLGLVSFLITHICYILAFRKDSKTGKHPRLLWQKPYTGIPVLLLFAALMYLLFNNIPQEMKIPVVVYASIITLMVLSAINRHDRVSQNSFRLVLTGAALFMISDSLIAINKFYYPFELARFLIMLLYISAQYLIAKGTIQTKPAI